MTKQVVNVGTVANDGTGDTQRAAFQKLQANCDEIYDVLSAYLAPNLYYPIVPATPAAGAAAISTTIYLIPFPVLKTTTFGALAVNVTTAEASKVFGLAIYANDTATGKPTGAAPLASTGLALSAGTTGVLDCPLSANVQLAPGWYWLAFQANSATAVWQAISAASGNQRFGAPLASLSGGATAVSQGIQFTNTFGTWPDLSTPPVWGYIQSNRMPFTWIKPVSFP